MNSQHAMAVTMSLKSQPVGTNTRWNIEAPPLVTQPGLLRRAKVWALKPSSWTPDKVRQNYVDSFSAVPR